MAMELNDIDPDFGVFAGILAPAAAPAPDPPAEWAQRSPGLLGYARTVRALQAQEEAADAAATELAQLRARFSQTKN